MWQSILYLWHILLDFLPINGTNSYSCHRVSVYQFSTLCESIFKLQVHISGADGVQCSLIHIITSHVLKDLIKVNFDWDYFRHAVSEYECYCILFIVNVSPFHIICVDNHVTDRSRQARTRMLHGHQLKTTWAVWERICCTNTSILFLLITHISF